MVIEKKKEEKQQQKGTDMKGSSSDGRAPAKMAQKAKSIVASAAPLLVTLNNSLNIKLTPELAGRLPAYIINDGKTALNTLNKINSAWQGVLQGLELATFPEVQYEAASQSIKDYQKLANNINTMIDIVQ